MDAKPCKSAPIRVKTARVRSFRIGRKFATTAQNLRAAGNREPSLPSDHAEADAAVRHAGRERVVEGAPQGDPVVEGRGPEPEENGEETRGRSKHGAESPRLSQEQYIRLLRRLFLSCTKKKLTRRSGFPFLSIYQGLQDYLCKFTSSDS